MSGGHRRGLAVAIMALYGALSWSLSGAAMSAGGTPPADIAWPHPGEVLRYHSCGCADACWVADVVDRRSRLVKASLRCDCENLSFRAQQGAAASSVALGRCEAINDSPDKRAAIRVRLDELTHPPKR